MAEGRKPDASGKAENALILANGDRPSVELLRRMRDEAELFIATDGAANDLAELDPVPDIVLGDFDSLAPGIRDRMPGAQFVQALDQEANDLEKAIVHAASLGYSHITIAGGLGGRSDHTLVSFSLLLKFGRELDIRLVAEGMEARAVFGKDSVYGEPGDTLSLIPFEASRVSLAGVKWPLKGEELGPGSRGVSNVIEAVPCEIDVVSGSVIVVVTKRQWLLEREATLGGG